MSTRILLLGSGGREHALVWKLARSPLIDHIYVCPGNPGTQQEPKTSNIIDIPLNDFPRLVGLVVPGTEQPIVDGVDAFFRSGISVFGPSALAARLEGSKAFSKDFMARYHIPTAKLEIFNSSQIEEVVEYVKTCGHQVVLKASGLVTLNIDGFSLETGNGV